MSARIRVAILDDHQSIIDGYTYRLSMDPDIHVAGTATFGEDLENMLSENEVDVLILDVSVPNSPTDRNQYPIIHLIPRYLEQYPKLNILVISMFTQHTLIEALVNIGISGYVFKDDQASIQQLDKIVRSICNGGIYFSPEAYRESVEETTGPILTPRQLEALSLCDSIPDGDTILLASRLGITGSTMRNLLSGSYLRLGVRTRAAAIAKAHQLGILPKEPEPVISGEARNDQSVRIGKAKPKPKRLKQISG